MKRVFCFVLAVCIITVNGLAVSGSSDVDFNSESSNVVDGYTTLAAYLEACKISIYADKETTWDDVCGQMDIWANQFVDETGEELSIFELYSISVRGGLVQSKKTWNLIHTFVDWLKTKLGLVNNTSNQSVTNSQVLNINFVAPAGRFYTTGGSFGNNTGFMAGSTGNVWSSNYYMFFVERNNKFMPGFILQDGKSYSYGQLLIGLYGTYYFQPVIADDWGDTGNVYSSKVFIMPYFKGAVNNEPAGYLDLTNVSDVSLFDVPVFHYSQIPQGSSMSVWVANFYNNPIVSEQKSIYVDTGEIVLPPRIPDDATGNESLAAIYTPGMPWTAGAAPVARKIQNMVITTETEAEDTGTDAVNGWNDYTNLYGGFVVSPVTVSPFVEIDGEGNVQLTPDVAVNIGPDDVVIDESAYDIDLERVFPFGIIFNVAEFLSLLQAEPETPNIDFDFTLPGSAEPITYNLSLSIFDPIMPFFRAGLAVLFDVSLLIFIWKKWG